MVLALVALAAVVVVVVVVVAAAVSVTAVVVVLRSCFSRLCCDRDASALGSNHHSNNGGSYNHPYLPKDCHHWGLVLRPAATCVRQATDCLRMLLDEVQAERAVDRVPWTHSNAFGPGRVFLLTGED